MTKARDIADLGDSIINDGNNNVALGDGALDDASLSGSNNVAIGEDALAANTSADNNTAVGYQAGYSNTTGDRNTYVGRLAGYTTTTSALNTAVGESALYLNVTGAENTAVGQEALRSNTASYNTAVGRASLYYNNSGANNTANGYQSLFNNTTASNNTAVGYQAGYSNTTGISNVYVGWQSGYSNTTALQNTYVGQYAGRNTTGNNNTFIGGGAGYRVTTGTKNTVLGSFDGNQGGLDIRTASNNIVLSDGDGNVRAYYNTDFGRYGRMSEIGSALSVSRHLVNNYVSGNAIVEYNHSTGTSPYGLHIKFDQIAPDNNSNWFFRCQDSSSNRLYIYSDGDIDNHDNSYSGMSDQKLKQQITDASSQWDDIKALQVRKYKMNEDVETYGDSDEHWRLGVIAQELETAGMSGLVTERPDKDDDDNDLGTTTKSVKYSILYMKAVKALQEAMDRIETLETKVAALEAE